MSADSKPIDYWTPGAPVSPHPPAQGQATSMFTGPDRVGCATMLGITAVASALSIGIVATLGWALA